MKALDTIQLNKKEKRSSRLWKADSSCKPSLADQIQFLQRNMGNQGLGRLIKSGALQAKLKIAEPQDKFELVADRVAEQVMRMPEPQNSDVGVDGCAKRGPAAPENHPLIYNCQETKMLGRTEQERCKRPAVGYAQQKLNIFLRRYDKWISGQGEELNGCIRNTDLIKSIRLSMKSPQLTVDCWFGNETYKATRMFQICTGLKDDGKIGEDTWPELEKVNYSGPPPRKVPPTTKPPPPQICIWPPQNPTPPPIPSKYSSMDPSLLVKLRESYISHTGRSDGSDFLDEGFRRGNPADKCTWPPTLWEALDIMGSGVLGVIDKVGERAKLFPFLWGGIERTRNSWSQPDNWGFKFYTPDENTLETNLIASDYFCRDFEWSENNYHQGQKCYREAGRSGIEGLHVCLGAGHFPDIHIDRHQIAKGKKDGKCDLDLKSWARHAIDVECQGKCKDVPEILKGSCLLACENLIEKETK